MLLHVLFISLLGVMPLPASDTSETVHDRLAEATVLGTRPLKEAGVFRTVLDTAALRENIAMSLAGILDYNSALFVKQYGRSSLSTVSFRGTSASHTQVMWNGMKLNSPMLGMTDFSMIPSYLVDGASLLHGTSSLQEVAGGLGGAVLLSTSPPVEDGVSLQYVQGAGSFLTFDEFLKFTYGGRNFKSSTRAVLSSSENKFKFRNYDKKENVYDEDMNIVDSYHPVEEYESGSFTDFHLLQEFFANTDSGHEFSLSAWYMRSYRQLPRITVDYGNAADFINEKKDNTLRAVFSWEKAMEKSEISASAGYSGTLLCYDYARDKGNGEMSYMTKSRSRVNSFHAGVSYEHRIASRLLVSADLTVDQHFVKSSDESVLMQGDAGARVGYDASRFESSGVITVRWKPSERSGIALSMREETYSGTFSPPIPALNVDYLLSRKGRLLLRGSVSRNYRYPTLNDLYFMPGGNPDLRPESGFSYDAGYSFGLSFNDFLEISGAGAWFDSYIDDWIMWVPEGARKDFYTPMNIMKVHAYGIEQKLSAAFRLSDRWKFSFDGNFTWSPSVNCGEPRSPQDESVGKQLVYIPEYSASFVGTVSCNSWKFIYKWCYYSTRYTMTSNDYSISGRVPPYFMSDVSLCREMSFSWSDMSLSISVYNLFNEEYMSVLARPMPGINYEIFIGIKPKFHRKR